MEALGLNRSRFLFFFPLTLGVHVASYTDFGFILSVSFLVFGVALLFYQPVPAIAFFIISIIVFDDINKYDVDVPPLNSLFTIDFFGQSISMLWSILVFLVIIFYLAIKKQNLKVAFPLLVLVLFFILGITRSYQFENPRFTSDIAFVVNILLGYATGMVLLNSEHRIKFYFGMIILVFLSKYIIITAHAVAASLTDVLYSFKGESASNYIIVPMTLMFLIIFNKGIRFSGTEKLIGYLAMLFIIAYLLITISRERILFVAFAIIGYLVVYKKAQIVVYIGILFILSVVILVNYNPNMYNFITWKFSSMLPSTDGTVNASSSVRLIEFINIWHEQVNSFYKPFVGVGWGGYFRDDYLPFPPEILGTTSFPPEWIENNTFFIPHGTYLYLLLKYGLLGTILFYGSFFAFSIKNLFDKTIYQLPFKDKSTWGLRYIQVVLSISLPIVCLVIFTSKLQILTGFFLAMIYYSKKVIAWKTSEITENELSK